MTSTLYRRYQRHLFTAVENDNFISWVFSQFYSIFGMSIQTIAMLFGDKHQ